MVWGLFSNMTRKLGLIRPWAYKLAHNPVAGAGLWVALFCFSGDATLFIRLPLWRKAVFCFRPAQLKTTCSYVGVKVRPSWTQRLHWAVLLTQLLHPPSRARYFYLELINMTVEEAHHDIHWFWGSTLLLGAMYRIEIGLGCFEHRGSIYWLSLILAHLLNGLKWSTRSQP